MNLTNYYWYFQSAIPNRICDDIARYGKQLQDEMAVTGGLGAKKLNQKQLAAAVNVTPKVINEFESGKAQPNEAVKRKIANYLKIKI